MNICFKQYSESFCIFKINRNCKLCWSDCLEQDIMLLPQCDPSPPQIFIYDFKQNKALLEFTFLQKEMFNAPSMFNKKLIFVAPFYPTVWTWHTESLDETEGKPQLRHDMWQSKQSTCELSFW